MDWIDTFSYLVMSIGFFGGYLSAISYSAMYAEVKHPLIDKLR